VRIPAFNSVGAWLGILLLAGALSGPVFAQGDGFKPLTGPVPRTADGHPDLSGLWQRPYTPDISPTARNGQQTADPSLAKNARGQAELPYTAWGKQQWDSYDAAKGDYTGACLPFGWMRSINSPDPLYIMQDKRAIGFLFEQNSWFHLAYLDRTSHPDLKNYTRTWFGDTIGKWEGDTLVLDTVGFNGRTRLDTNGHPMSDQLHVTERWTRTDLGHLTYEVTVDDPKTYTKPWKNTRVFISRPDWQIIEYSCEENNKDYWENRVSIPDFARPQ
jgi:hypothetical protein